MDFLKAITLGVIEGLTEFLPVSSTAHLLLASYLIDFWTIKNNLFEIVIQFGAILAILVLYRKRVFELVLKIKEKKQQKFILNLIIAFLPAAIIGGLFHGFIKQYLFANLVIALALIIGGVIMILIERKKPKSQIEDVENISLKAAFFIGLFQALAMVPGISRSGATIIGGILLGLNRKAAAEFSFFLAIPTIAAASFYDLLKNYRELSFDNMELILVGMIASFISALLVIKWFIHFISRNSFAVFGIYRIALGVLVILFLV